MFGALKFSYIKILIAFENSMKWRGIKNQRFLEALKRAAFGACENFSIFTAAKPSKTLF